MRSEQNIINQQYDAKMTLKYKGKIQDGNLEIGDWCIGKGDAKVTNLRFIEKLEITTLKLIISNAIDLKVKNDTIIELIVKLVNRIDSFTIDDLKLQNLETLLFIDGNQLTNNQLYNLVKFKKLHTLDVSFNNVNLSNIHSVKCLTNLSMRQCGLTKIDQITSLINLQELDLSANIDLDICPLCKVTSLTKLKISDCNLKQIDQIRSLTNLEVLDLSINKLVQIESIRYLVNVKELRISYNQKIDITPLQYLVGLIKLDVKNCGLKQLSALKSLINLQALNVSFNYFLNISELQYLKNLTYLNLKQCNIVSIYVLKPLIKLISLQISNNEIVYLDSNLNEMKQLEVLYVQFNRISDFTSLEKHQNRNNNGNICFNIQNQREPFKEELHYANQMRDLEHPNIQLKDIQNKHKILNTQLNACKLKISELPNQLHYNQMQLASSAVHLFQQLDQLEFE
ncbi:leucine-rich_repeat domain-containing protein [Hexamita inflata]|uniref:Leucine-rich repeat domain-containing protein n=1 Tax=Hexamita inflata TaxID=28002 RepID=A0AA86U2C6_9EUKA|nr:leucine-rich repeat domain-containing protein [Hexamita inflata]